MARLAAAARHCELTAIELSSETSEYAWDKIPDGKEFKRLTLFRDEDSRASAAKEVSRRLDSTLTQCKPDLVAIPGWSDKGALAALAWCAEQRVPTILMSESTADDERRLPWREMIKRRVVRFFSTALVGGQRHADYLAALGMSRDRVFTGYDVVDNGYFAQSAKEVRSQEAEVRKRYELPEKYFFASGRFIEKKNLFTLIRAYAAYCERSPLVTSHSSPWRLVLLGDGPLRADLCRLISELGLQNSVLLPGFKQYEELPAYYALANAFVHASTTEQWGLVVNEAMASGLPVIVSNRCGCVPELVHENVNGFTFDPYDTDQLAKLLTRVGSLPRDEWERLSSSSRSIAFQHGPERFGEGLRNAVEAALESPRTRATLPERILIKALLYR